MNQESRPLYGELVIPFNADSQPSGAGEARMMEDQSLELRSMIEEAAYFLAEKRSFVAGHEIEDWLQAEAQVLRNILR